MKKNWVARFIAYVGSGICVTLGGVFVSGFAPDVLLGYIIAFAACYTIVLAVDIASNDDWKEVFKPC